MNKIMKSYINKIFTLLCVALMLGMTSCIGDLDLVPNDPNTLTSDKFKENPSEYLMAVMAKCYSGMAVSGQTGPNGDSDISGLDGGTSQYTRTLFMMNEFTTDECIWMYSSDSGVNELVLGTWGANATAIEGSYSRLYVHIAICNEFLRLVQPSNLELLEISVDDELQATIDQYCLEARALRAMSYYNTLDLFGNTGFIDDNMASGTDPIQMKRSELYAWLVDELKDLVSQFPTTTPIYSRVGIDGVEALLARTYLNAKVFAGVDASAECQACCQNIINRRKGGGYNGTGLAKHYLYLFCGDNDVYMPGGSKSDENEILWGIPFDSEYIQPYGGTTFLIAGAMTNTGESLDDAPEIPYMNALDYGSGSQWGCMHARKEFSQKFTDADIRWSMWCKEANGFSIENTGFTTFTDGFAAIKFTNLIAGEDGAWSAENGGIYDPTGTISARGESFPDTDLPLIRLADVYLMYAECYIVGGQGDAATALEYVNNVRGRAGVTLWSASDMTATSILDERSRELYWENTRRTDLIRFGKFTGSDYIWSWKGGLFEGTSISSYRDLFPIPTNVIAVQPEFEQNTGY
ncbi:MAG: RagB/SusD family nutrient uptake outer membrane protein [Bacteroidales bacterium]